MPSLVEVAESLRENTVDEETVITFGLADRDSPTSPSPSIFRLRLEIDTSGDKARVRLAALLEAVALRRLDTFASPAMTYLLLLIGAALLIFEFYTAGVGMPECSARVASSSAATALMSCRPVPGRWHCRSSPCSAMRLMSRPGWPNCGR